jgi:HEAT repeat protein
VQLVTSLFLAGPIITKFGLGWALMALPVVNGFGMAVAAGVSFWAGLGESFFWLIMLIKLCDESLRASLLAPAFRILYQPLPVQERLAFQAKTESIIEPIGVGLVGMVLILLTSVWPVSLPQLCLILVVILAIWIGVAELLRHEYTRMLTRALSHRRLGGATVILEDGSSATIFLQGTQSTNPGEVIYCLSMLEEIGHAEWPLKLEAALNHADSQVRIYALHQVETKGLKSLQPTVHHLWQSDVSPPVRRTALQTYCALGEEDILEEVTELLTHADEAWRLGSMVGLLRSGGIEGVMVAGTHLQSLLRSPQSTDRKQAAEMLGEVGMPNFHRPLIQLLQDPSHEVRRAALRSAGKLKNPRLLPWILENLPYRDLRPMTIHTLRLHGAPLIPMLKKSLQEESSPEIRRSLVRVLGQIGGPEATAVLLQQLPGNDKSLRRQVLKALTHLHYVAPEDFQNRLKRLVRDQVTATSLHLLTLAELSRAAKWPLLCQALAGEMQEDGEQLLMLLAFFPGAQALRRLQKELRSPSRTQRARAIELLENLIPPEIKCQVLPFLDDLTLDQQAERVAAVFPTSPSSHEERLVTLAQTTTGQILRWTKACALYELGRGKIQTGLAALQQCLSEEEPLLRQTATWAAQQF